MGIFAAGAFFYSIKSPAINPWEFKQLDAPWTFIGDLLWSRWPPDWPFYPMLTVNKSWTAIICATIFKSLLISRHHVANWLGSTKRIFDSVKNCCWALSILSFARVSPREPARKNFLPTFPLAASLAVYVSRVLFVAVSRENVFSSLYENTF